MWHTFLFVFIAGLSQGLLEARKRKACFFMALGKSWNESVLQGRQSHLWHVGLYLFFGVCTTLVNLLLFLALFRGAGLSGWLANTLAWFPSVVFAWATNRRWVFHARQGMSVVALGGELLSFSASRLATGALDVLLVYLAIDLARLPELPAKVAIGVIVVGLNYGISRWLVFCERKQA